MHEILKCEYPLGSKSHKDNDRMWICISCGG